MGRHLLWQEAQLHDERIHVDPLEYSSSEVDINDHLRDTVQKHLGSCPQARKVLFCIGKVRELHRSLVDGNNRGWSNDYNNKET